jgi:hypothetical protein
VLKGVLGKGGANVGLEEVWVGTEGILAGKEGEIRIAYVDALIAHIQMEGTGEEESVLPKYVSTHFRMCSLSPDS